MANYESKIIDSAKELTARERLKFKDSNDATALDAATDEGEVYITPVNYAIVEVHNDASPNKEYHKYVIVDADGTFYTTGSESFWRSFKSIWDEMFGEDEDWKVKVFKRDGKSGKKFITCSIV